MRQKLGRVWTTVIPMPILGNEILWDSNEPISIEAYFFYMCKIISKIQIKVSLPIVFSLIYLFYPALAMN